MKNYISLLQIKNQMGICVLGKLVVVILCDVVYYLKQ